MIRLIKGAAVHAVRVTIIITSDVLYEAALALDFLVECIDNEEI